jgi:hypothetical protein
MTGRAPEGPPPAGADSLAGPPARLRDLPTAAGLAASTSGALVRAAAVVRAVPLPAPLSPAADARILAGLRRQQARGPLAGVGLRVGRVLLTGAALLLVVVSGVRALAALGWLRPLPPAPAPTIAAPVAPAAGLTHPPPPTPAPQVAPPRPIVHLSALARPREAAFTRARLAIDPHAPAHRPQVPAELWRAHVGENFTWKVKICVDPRGQVRDVALLQRRHPVLDREIARAIAQWRYHPAERAGVAVASCSVLVYQLAVEPPAP